MAVVLRASLQPERHPRALTGAHELFTDNTDKAVQVLIDIASDGSVPPVDLIRAAIISTDTDPDDDDSIEGEILS